MTKNIQSLDNIVTMVSSRTIERCRANPSEQDWKNISKIKLTNEFIDEFGQYLDWYWLLTCQKNIPYHLFKKYKNVIDWDHISRCTTLTEEFIEACSNEINWPYVSQSQRMSTSFVEKHKDKINFNYYIFNSYIDIEHAYKIVISSDRLHMCNTRVFNRVIYITNQYELLMCKHEAEKVLIDHLPIELIRNINCYV